MPHPHDPATNILLAIFLGATWSWVGLIESYGMVMTHILVPTLSALVLAGQLWLIWRRRQRK